MTPFQHNFLIKKISKFVGFVFAYSMSIFTFSFNIMCYLLNKLIFNRSTQTIYFCIVMKISSHIMKDILVTNNVGISDVLFSRNLNVLAFGGLGELSNRSLATENIGFRQLTVLT